MVCPLEQRDFDDPGIDDLMNGEMIPNFGDSSGRKHDMTILRTDNVRSIRGWPDFETWTDQTTKPRRCAKKPFDKKSFIFKEELLIF